MSHKNFFVNDFLQKLRKNWLANSYDSQKWQTDGLAGIAWPVPPLPRSKMEWNIRLLRRGVGHFRKKIWQTENCFVQPRLEEIFIIIIIIIIIIMRDNVKQSYSILRDKFVTCLSVPEC